MLRRRRLLPSLLIAAGALLARPAAATPTAALADCPGSSSVDLRRTRSVGQTGSRGGGVLRFPQAVAVGPDGNVYVTDQGSHLVQKFTPAGQWLADIGSAGTRPGELSAIGAIAVTGDNQVVVADGGTNRVVRFSGGDGEPDRLLGRAGQRPREVPLRRRRRQRRRGGRRAGGVAARRSTSSTPATTASSASTPTATTAARSSRPGRCRTRAASRSAARGCSSPTTNIIVLPRSTPAATCSRRSAAARARARAS